MPRVLADRDIEKYLEEIPSDGDSLCSAESDQEPQDVQPPTMLLGDVVGEDSQNYSFEEEDNEPLSSLRSTLPSELTTPIVEASSSSNVQTEAPKWKRNNPLSPAEMNVIKDKLRMLMRRVDKKFIEQFDFSPRDVTFMKVVNYLHKPKDSSSLAVTRILFGVCMLFDITEERGGATMNRRWGDPRICHFPLLPFITVMPMTHMAFVYLAMWFGALGIMLGYKYKNASVTFAVCYWYLFLIEKSYWNNHSYLFGLIAFLLCFTQANCYWSLDVYVFPRTKRETVPYWNYFLLKYQLFILYFMAGLKKGTAEWLTGYSVPTLSEHWVFAPFRLFLTVPQIDYIIVHWFIFLFDLTIAMWMMWGRTRHVAMIFCALFHLMNTRLFTIGMFPWVCLATMPLFYPFDWPKRVIPILKHLKTNIFNKILHSKADSCCQCKNHECAMPDDRNEQIHDKPSDEDKCDKDMNNTQNHVSHKVKDCYDDSKLDDPTGTITDHCKEFNMVTEDSNTCKGNDTGNERDEIKKKVTTVAIFLYVLVQLFLPYSHFITKGYNNWTNGLYGYSWDMMVHTWHTHAVVVKIVDNKGNNQFFVDPFGYSPNDRWTRHGDMVYQYAHCLRENLLTESRKRKPEEQISVNLSIYIDVWCSLNSRFIQRMFDNKVDLLKANWSPFEKNPFLMPIIEEGEEWRSKLEEMKAEVQMWSNISDVVFLAEFPGYQEEKYITHDLRNVTISSIKGIVAVEPEQTTLENGQTIVLFPGDHTEIQTGLFHKVRNIGKTFAYYMYTFENVTELEKPKTRARPKLPIARELYYRLASIFKFFGLLVDNIFPRCFWTSRRCYQ